MQTKAAGAGQGPIFLAIRASSFCYLRPRAMSCQKMKETGAQLTAVVADLLRQAQEVDEEEDRRYGKDKRGDDLPEELAFREDRLEKIREVMAAL